MTDAGFYIDSPDTRSYLREIRYKFTIEEEAYLVWQCRRITLEAKFAAWEEIIQTTPDSAVIGRPFGRGERVDSIHQFLRDYMALQKQRLTEFSQPGRWVYTAGSSARKPPSGRIWGTFSPSTMTVWTPAGRRSGRTARGGERSGR